MDPNLLSNYEVVYETLSASESDSETNETPVEINTIVPKEITERRRIIKNFVICQPIAQGKVTPKGTSRTEEHTSSVITCTDVSTQYPEDSLLIKGNNGISHSELNDAQFADEGSYSSKKTINNNVNKCSGNKRKLQADDSCEISEGLDDEILNLRQYSKQDWSAAVNYIDDGGPSMNTIQKVIEQTVCRALRQELPSGLGRMGIVMDTYKKNCPYCKFSTLSRYSFRKHIALHENKPQLVFSQGFSEEPISSNLILEKYQCPNCFDLFRTEAGLKYHKNCLPKDPVFPVQHSALENNGEDFHQKSVISTPNEPIVATALRFLSQKQIDLETTKQHFNLISEKLTTVEKINKDEFKKTLLEESTMSSEKYLELCNKTNSLVDHNFVGNDSNYGKRRKQNTEEETQNSKENTSSSKNSLPEESENTRHLRRILEEPVDIKKENSPMEEEYVQFDNNVDGRIKLEPYQIVLENIKTEVEDIENIKREIIENGTIDEDNPSSYDDIERRIAVLTGEEDNADSNEFVLTNIKTEVGDLENIKRELTENGTADEDTSTKYDDLERRLALVTGEEENTNSNRDGRNFSSSENTENFSCNTIGDHNNQDHNTTDLQVDWRKKADVCGAPRKFSEERLQFNKMADSWLKTYQELYPHLSARVHVPGGIPCPDCQLYYKSFHLLRRHWARIHDPSLPVLTCSDCNYKTNQKGLLDSHFKYAHNKNLVKIHSCDKCNKTYKSSSHLVRHKLINHTDKTNLLHYKCELCTFTSVVKSNVKKHFERKHVNVGKNYLCAYCGLLVKSKFTIEKHEMTHLGKVLSYTCKICFESFDHKLDLYSHQQIVHSEEPVYFNCESCEFRSLNKELLVVHNNVVHLNIKHFKCSDCSSTLKDLDTLAQHITRMHNPYISWKYCAHCSYKSLKKGAIASHVSKHLPRNIAPIKCKLCKYRTYKSEYYKRHYNTRHNPNAIIYQCYHCDYVNKVKAKLHQHMLEKRHLLT